MSADEPGGPVGKNTVAIGWLTPGGSPAWSPLLDRACAVRCHRAMEPGPEEGLR
jgi:hypothetical protein